MIGKGTISGTIAKKVFAEMFDTGKKPEAIVQEKGLVQNSNLDEIKSIVLKVLSENEQSVIDYKSGKTRAFGFLVGQIMKASKGKANPAIVNGILKEELDK
jgi:aspartyl-tRNA(Asn)/glutamyl-tRNA(Gln) amidotransferase subunit B